MHNPHKTMNEIFLKIIRAGLWQKEAPQIHSLTPSQWEELFAMATEQAMLPVFFDGISLLQEDLRPGFEIRTRKLSEVLQVEMAGDVMEEAIASLFSKYKEIGVRPLLMKGQGLAMLWNNPKHRIPGDIDVYFPNKGDDEKANKWIEKEVEGTFNDYEERHLSFSWNGIWIENHSFLTIFSSKKIDDAFRKIVDEALLKSTSIYHITLRNGYEVEILPPTLNFLYQIIHITRHLYNQGIGIRQLADIAYFASHHHADIDKTLLKQYVEALRLQVAANVIGAFVADHLGLSEEMWPLHITRTSLDAKIYEDILTGGNFGKKRFKHKEKQNAKQALLKSFLIHAKRHWLYRSLQPGEILPDYLIKFKHVFVQWRKGNV